MPEFSETKILPYKPEQIYELVMDIEKYPEFLPWCKKAKIIDVISEQNLTADLLINFKNIFEKYRSNVKHGIDENDHYFVEVKAIEGPFKKLINRWKFFEDEQGCKIEFFIDFEFNSFFLEKMLGVIFGKATKKMMNAFETRAHEKYDEYSA